MIALLQSASPVSPSSGAVSLWVIGMLCSFIGALLLILLSRVLKQGDDTNGKVTNQGVTLSRMEISVADLYTRVNVLHDWRTAVNSENLAKVVEELAVERRKNTRRADDRENL